jgi:hypothetical protein
VRRCRRHEVLCRFCAINDLLKVRNAIDHHAQDLETFLEAKRRLDIVASLPIRIITYVGDDDASPKQIAS